MEEPISGTLAGRASQETLAELLAESRLEVEGLRQEVEGLRRELAALRQEGPWAPAGLADELLGMELVHEYNTRSS